MDILANLTNIELTHLFSGLVVIEGQYSFKGGSYPGQGKVANDIIDTATGAEILYRHIMKYDQHKKSLEALVCK